MCRTSRMAIIYYKLYIIHYLHGVSLVGRISVSKTEGRGFESLTPCSAGGPRRQFFLARLPFSSSFAITISFCPYLYFFNLCIIS